MDDLRSRGPVLLCEPMAPSRRAVLGAAGALFAWTFMPRYLHAAGNRDARFICIVLRGALDGLAAVPPIGDPDYERQRQSLALRLGGEHPAFRLDDLFALHPAMPNLARLFQLKQVAIVHAASTGYHSRSHFDGQDALESGYAAATRGTSGWLNRFLATMPAGEKILQRGVLGVGVIPPLVVRGPAPVIGWAPATAQRTGEGLAERVLELYAERDPELAMALTRGLDADRLAVGQGVDAKNANPASPNGMKYIAEGTARLIAADDGPRIAALAFEGWDTHAKAGGATGQLASRLGGLDSAIAAFERLLGDKWRDTVLMVTTEFGRTVRVNGSAGTDHGIGTVVLLVGGGVKGGRVIADWPGLADNKLFQGRDLAPTADVRGVAKGVLMDLFGASAAVLADKVFPDTGNIRPIRDLIA